jgi:hypothetical protein
MSYALDGVKQIITSILNVQIKSLKFYSRYSIEELLTIVGGTHNRVT